jgi:hypothetical protein
MDLATIGNFVPMNMYHQQKQERFLFSVAFRNGLTEGRASKAGTWGATMSLV